MEGIVGVLIGVCWMAALALLCAAGYHRLAHAPEKTARVSAWAGWASALAVAGSVITIAIGGGH